MKIQLTKIEVKHLIFIMKHRGIFHCGCCKDIFQELESKLTDNGNK